MDNLAETNSVETAIIPKGTVINGNRRHFMNQKNSTAYKIALTGLTAALSYVVFTFLVTRPMPNFSRKVLGADKI